VRLRIDETIGLKREWSIVKIIKLKKSPIPKISIKLRVDIVVKVRGLGLVQVFYQTLTFYLFPQEARRIAGESIKEASPYGCHNIGRLTLL
jgi:hypothetical protein